MLQSENMTAPQAIVQGTATSILILFFTQMLHLLIPYFIVLIAMVTLDLVEGIKASKKRNEEIRISRAVRRTVSKLFEYCCWIIFAGSLRVATGSVWLFVIILIIPLTIEICSIWTNYAFSRGKKITGLNLLKIFGKKIGADIEDIKIEDIDKKDN